ncbi:MAG TPA: flagellar hook-associated protein FlgL [Phycisphaerae bacterium]|nr:flagellar hook-associated protein FlgL [Phycisphaerae bacterium]
MSVVPLQIGRVSMQMTGTLLAGTLNNTQSDLLKVQQQLSTGQRLTLASDDPTAAIGIMQLNRQLAGNTQYSSNLNFANSFLAQADGSLGTVSDLINQASSIASSEVGAGASSDERASQAQVVDSMITQLLNLANTQYQGQSVFAGAATGNAAFVAAGAGYQYNGSTDSQGVLGEDGTTIDYTVNGGQVFGGLSAQVASTQSLNPALTSATRLADLNGAVGNGIGTGPVTITVGSTSVTADLSHAATAGDVVNIVNAALTGAGSDASIGLSGGGFAVTGDSTQALTIADAAGGSTAKDLGISGTVAAAGTLAGTNVGPKVTVTTPLSALNGGAGIDPSGIVISNGGTSATIPLAGLNTVGDLLNAINNAGNGNLHVQASINAAGTGINLLNPVSGSNMTVGENGGSTASALGIRSMSASTKVADLNGGAGIGTASATMQGPTGQIVITRTDGTSFNVTLDGVKSVSQLIAAINSASGNTTVTATLNGTGNGITLTDTSGGAGNLSVTGGTNFNANGSLLGIFQTGTGGTLTGTDITFSTDDFRITRHDGTSFSVNVSGAATIQDVLNAINNADGNGNPANKVTASLNANGNGISLSDASAGSGALAVTATNGSAAATGLGIAGSSVSATLNGQDVNPISPTGLFSSLIMLRNALLNNDTTGIQRAATLLSQNSTQVATARGIIGAREQDISARQTTATNENTALQSALSLLSDTDMTTTITKFQQLQTSYQAALQTAETTRNLSLLDFLTS